MRRVFKILMLGLVLLLVTAIPVWAETTLMGDDQSQIGVWGIDLKTAPILGTQGIWLGGYSGRIMKDGSLYLGTAGYLLITPITAPAGAPDIPGFSTNVCLFYCGLTGEYTMNPGSLIHVGGNVLAGLYYVKYVGVGADSTYNLNGGLAGLGFVVEPGVNVMMNVTDSFKAGIGVSYRWVTGLNIQGMTNEDLSALSFNLIFKFVEF